MSMQKINEIKVQKYGERGLTVAIPKVFASDNNIKYGDEVEIYRDNKDGRDALIIIPKSFLSNTTVTHN